MNPNMGSYTAGTKLGKTVWSVSPTQGCIREKDIK